MADEARAETVEAPVEPEEILESRKLLVRAGELLDSGEVESVSIYINRRDGCYQTLQAATPSRLQEAGMLMEMIVNRLGFVDRDTVQAMIDASK
jgi:hypothetical protein